MKDQSPLLFGGTIQMSALWIMLALAMSIMACSTTDFARDILMRLPTATATLPAPPEPISSETWYVTIGGDDGNDCASAATPCRTIRAAIDKADNGDTVQIGAGSYGAALTGEGSPSLLIDKPIILVGAGPDVTVLDGDSSSTVVLIDTGGQVGFHDLAIANGGPVEGRSIGCGLRNMADDGHVVLNNVVVRDNVCRLVAYGGAGILNLGDMILINVRVEDNTLGVPEVHTGQGMGAGIMNLGTLDMDGGTIRRNRNLDWRGGGFVNGFTPDTVATLTDVWIDSNEAVDWGGGVVNSSATLEIQRSTISNNQLDGITNEQSEEPRLHIINSTVSGNDGPGLRTWGSLTLNHSTITNNEVGVLYLPSIHDASLTFDNSIIAGNHTYSINSQGAALLGFDYLAHTNLWGPVDPLYGPGFGRASSRDHLYKVTDPGLEALTDNGGSTPTHALQPLSPAVDQIDRECLLDDQRSEPRPQPEGGNCDIGAYELAAVAMSLEGTPISLATVTATPIDDPGQPTVITDGLCWKGPGPLYEVVSSLSAGTQVSLLGRGAEGDWWVIDNPRYPGVACWVEDDDLSVDPLIELEELRIYAIPPLPTPTATPILGCLYYDQNQAEVCYPIDQCPVDFEDSLGACTP